MALRTGQSAGNTLLLQAYDVDGASWSTFATLTANNTPTMDLDAAVTHGGKALTFAGSFTTSGAYALTLTLTATTNVTLPTTGTLATLAGAETFANKTLTTPTIGSFTNATHDHSNAAGGGQITDSALSSAVGITKGGSGQITAQAAIDALSQVVGATDEYVLTKDTASGNALWKMATSTGGLNNVVEDVTPQLGGALDTNSFAINESKGATIADSATPDIFNATDGSTIHLAGTTTITDFPNAPAVGLWRKIIFDGVKIVTHGSGITVQGAANWTTAANDFAFVYADTVSAFFLFPIKADGTAVIETPSDPSISASITADPAPAVVNTFYPCDVSGGDFTVTLPAASGNSGKRIWIKLTTGTANTLTVDGASGETIDGAATITLDTQYDSLTLLCDGSNWHVI
tara:strand:- start:294 stop:1505 length:1212 start_codon:yes stop_codon:yes gene_type:complete